MTINKRLTPYNYSSRGGKKIEYIVIHYVGAVSTAKNNAVYYANNKLNASAHYFVDENEIWQSVADENAAWHCGGSLQGEGGHAFFGKCTNANSLGIEMCVKQTASGAWYFEDRTVENTVWLVRELMAMYGIPISKVIRHYDVTGKHCPAPYVDEGAWAAFKARLKKDVFTDVSDHWAKSDIEALCGMGIVQGDGGGRFRPDDGITRAECAAMIRRAIRYITGK